jgi:guanylate kinase
MKGNALFIVGNHGSGKSFLARHLENAQAYFNLTPSGLKQIGAAHNVVLEINDFTENSMKLLPETVRKLIQSGKHVYLLCSPATYDKIKYQILNVLEVEKEAILNE